MIQKMNDGQVELRHLNYEKHGALYTYVPTFVLANAKAMLLCSEIV